MRYFVLALLILVPVLEWGTVSAALNINSATYDQLDALPGVGEVTANRIISHRAANGAFSDLSQVCALVGTNGVSVETSTCQNIGTAVYFGALGEATTAANNDEEKSEETTTTKSTNSRRGAEVDHDPVSGLVVKIPSMAYTGQLVDFEVEPEGGTDGRLVRYSWNFGDGAVSAERTASHQYQRPGTYLVVVESYFQKETKLVRKELTILPLSIKLTVLPGGGTEVKNEGKHEMDLSGMSLSGSSDFVFAKNTILLPGASLVVESVAGGVIKDENGLALSTLASPVVAPRTTVKRVSASPAVVAATSTVAATNEPNEEIVDLNVAAAAAAPLPSKAWPYLGLLAIMSFGFVALFTARPV